MEQNKIKMTFGIQEHHIKRINDERAKWNQPDKDIPGTPPDAIYIEGFWEQLGREVGWAPFTLALHYMRAGSRIDSNTGYRSLWDYLHFNHGLKLLESEVGDLVHFVHKFHPKEEYAALRAKADKMEQAINGAMRIRELWQYSGEISEEHADEAAALANMERAFCDILDPLEGEKKGGMPALEAPILTDQDMEDWKNWNRGEKEPVPQQGPVWVKASERLPGKHIDVIVRNIKTRRVKVTQNFGHNIGWDVAMDNEFRWDNTEWLDEIGREVDNG